MGVPTSEVGYTAAMPSREDHEVHKDMWWHWTNKKKSSKLYIKLQFVPQEQRTVSIVRTNQLYCWGKWSVFFVDSHSQQVNTLLSAKCWMFSVTTDSDYIDRWALKCSTFTRDNGCEIHWTRVLVVLKPRVSFYIHCTRCSVLTETRTKNSSGQWSKSCQLQRGDLVDDKSLLAYMRWLRHCDLTYRHYTLTEVQVLGYLAVYMFIIGSFHLLHPHLC